MLSMASRTISCRWASSRPVDPARLTGPAPLIGKEIHVHRVALHETGATPDLRSQHLSRDGTLEG